MASFNKVILMGYLTRDPEMRYTPSGAAICNIGLATNRRYTTAQGEQREESCFIDIEVWGKQAESCKTYLRKGSQALIEGRLRFDQWDDKDTGKKRSKLMVTAERVQFIGSRPEGGGGEGGDGGYNAPQQQQYQQPQQAAPEQQQAAPPQQQYQPPPQQQAASPLPPFPADAAPAAPASPPNPDSGGAADASIDDIPF